jgi:AcrR family transcriptional regulator
VPYHHFESKDDLLRHIQEEYPEAQLAAIQTIEAGSDDPVPLESAVRARLPASIR